MRLNYINVSYEGVIERPRPGEGSDPVEILVFWTELDPKIGLSPVTAIPEKVSAVTRDRSGLVGIWFGLWFGVGVGVGDGGSLGFGFHDVEAQIDWCVEFLCQVLRQGGDRWG